MNKAEFVKKIAELTETSQVDTKPYVDAFMDAVIETLCKGDSVELMGFGKFSTGKRDAYVGRNPKTKEPLEIPATTTVKFTPSKCFKEAVNE